MVNRYEQLRSAIVKGSFYDAGDHILPRQDAPYEFIFDNTQAPSTEFGVFVNNTFRGVVTTDANGAAIVRVDLDIGESRITIENNETGRRLTAYADVRNWATWHASYADSAEQLDANILSVNDARTLENATSVHISDAHGQIVKLPNSFRLLTETYRATLRAYRQGYRLFSGKPAGVEQLVAWLLGVDPLIIPKAWRPRWFLGSQFLPNGKFDTWAATAAESAFPPGSAGEFPALNIESIDYVHASFLDSALTAPGPITNPPSAQPLTVTFDGSWAGGDITITGTAPGGGAVVETFVAAVSTTVEGSITFETVTSITNSSAGAGAGAATVGLGESAFIKIVGFIGYPFTGGVDLGLTTTTGAADALIWNGTTADDEYLTEIPVSGRYEVGSAHAVAEFSGLVPDTYDTTTAEFLYLEIDGKGVVRVPITVGGAVTAVTAATDVNTAFTADPRYGTVLLAGIASAANSPIANIVLVFSAFDFDPYREGDGVKIHRGCADAALEIFGLPRYRGTLDVATAYTDTSVSYTAAGARLPEITAGSEDIRIGRRRTEVDTVSGASVVNFRSVRAAIQDNGGVFSNFTTQANEATADDIDLLPLGLKAVGDAFYVGARDTFAEIEFEISTAGAGAWALTWEYWDGTAWTALAGVTDNTTDFTVAGTNSVTFTRPDDWEETTVNTQGPFFYVRARVTTGDAAPTTDPLGARVVILGTATASDRFAEITLAGGLDLNELAAVVHPATIAGDDATLPGVITDPVRPLPLQIEWGDVWGGDGALVAGTDATGTTIVDVFTAEPGKITTGSLALDFATVSGATLITERNVEAAIQNDGGTYTDYTAEANNATTDDIVLLPPGGTAVGDAFYVGSRGPHREIEFNISTAGSGLWALTWEYWDGSAWSALAGVTDNTTDFKTAGTNSVTFTPPTDWVAVTVAGQGPYYYVRARITTADGSPVTDPLGTRVLIKGNAADTATGIGIARFRDTPNGCVRIENATNGDNDGLHEIVELISADTTLIKHESSTGIFVDSAGTDAAIDFEVWGPGEVVTATGNDISAGTLTLDSGALFIHPIGALAEQENELPHYEPSRVDPSVIVVDVDKTLQPTNPSDDTVTVNVQALPDGWEVDAASTVSIVRTSYFTKAVGQQAARLLLERGATDITLTGDAPRVSDDYKGFPIRVSFWVQQHNTVGDQDFTIDVDWNNGSGFSTVVTTGVPGTHLEDDTSPRGSLDPRLVTGTAIVPFDATLMTVRLTHTGSGAGDEITIERATVTVDTDASSLFLNEGTIVRTDHENTFGEILYVWVPDDPAVPGNDQGEREALGVPTDGTGVPGEQGHIDWVTNAHGLWNRFDVTEYDGSNLPQNVVGPYDDAGWLNATLSNTEIVVGSPPRLTYVQPSRVSAVIGEELAVSGGGVATLAQDSSHAGPFPEDPNGTARLYKDGVPIPDTPDDGTQPWEFTAADAILIDAGELSSGAVWTIDYEVPIVIETDVLDLVSAVATPADYMWAAGAAVFQRQDNSIGTRAVTQTLTVFSDLTATLDIPSDQEKLNAVLTRTDGIAVSEVPAAQWSYISADTIQIASGAFDPTFVYEITYVSQFASFADVANAVLEVRSAATAGTLPAATYAPIDIGEPVDNSLGFHQLRYTLSNVTDTRDFRVGFLGLRGVHLFGATPNAPGLILP